MKKQLFREKSLERISSPEQLNDYIRVTNPGVWLILLGILFTLVGVCVWGIFGRLDTTLSVGAITNEGQTVCFVKEADRDRITADMTVNIDEQEYRIAEIATTPILVSERFPEYLRHIGSLSEGEWVYVVTLDALSGEQGGIYRADIVIESIAPLHFVTN